MTKAVRAQVISLTRLAWRDLRASSDTLVIFSIVALSVATCACLWQTSGNFAEGLQIRTRAELAADLLVDPLENPDPAQWRALQALSKTGVRSTLLTLATFAARSDQTPDPVAVIIKGVDPQVYPMYGEIDLEPPQSLPTALAGRAAVVSAALLRRLGLAVGDQLRVGGISCRISAKLAWEPDRFFNENYSSSLRVMVSRETLEASGVLRALGPSAQLVLVLAGGNWTINSAQARLERIFPQGLVLGLGELNPEGRQAVDTTARSIVTVSWLAWLMGAAGLIMATWFHVRSRIQTLSTLKMLGARPVQCMLFLAAQLAMAGAAGGAAGGLVGCAAQGVLLHAAALSIRMSPGSCVTLMLAGLGGGAVFCVFAGMGWAIATCGHRPSPLLRSAAPHSPIAPSLLHRGVKRLFLGPARYGVENVFRTGTSSVLVMVAIMTMFAAVLAGGRGVVVQSILRSLPLSNANLYLTGFPHFELPGVRQILDRHPGIKRPYDFMNLVWLRVAAEPIEASDQSPQLRMVNCSEDLRASSGAVVDTRLAFSLGLHAGSDLYLQGDSVSLRIKVSRVRALPPAQRNWYSVTVPCSAVNSREMLHGAMLRVPQKEIAALTGELNAKYPLLGVVDPSEFFAEINRLLVFCALLVRVLTLAALVGGMVLIVAVLTASSRQRAAELAVFRVLGARRTLLARMLTSEFVLRGLLAGLLGGLAGIISMDFGLSYAWDVPVLDLQASTLGLALVMGTLLSVMAGWFACGNLLRQRPLIALRRD